MLLFYFAQNDAGLFDVLCPQFFLQLNQDLFIGSLGFVCLLLQGVYFVFQ